MLVTCLFFAVSKQLSGTAQAQFDIPEQIILSQFISDYLLPKYPQLTSHIDNYLISVNQEYSDRSIVIPPNSEIAIIPPVSGG